MGKQLHVRLTEEQVDAILSRYLKRELKSDQAMDMLGLGRSQFFEWVKRYKEGCRDFTIAYARKTGNHKIESKSEEYIMKELNVEKALINDPAMPVRTYNYSFIRDEVRKKYGQEVSVPTIINRAKKTAFISRSQKEDIMIGRSSPIMQESLSSMTPPCTAGRPMQIHCGILSPASTITAAISSTPKSWKKRHGGITSHRSRLSG